jgi:cobalt-zinc-cadmium efflux system protein
MKTERNILIAFILNLLFSVFEFVGGVITGSVAIVSDAVHDLGDAASIGISYFLEKKSKKKPDETYTYGYMRFSVVGGFITTLILLLGSVVMIYNAIIKIFNPSEINYNGMIIFALVGVGVNFCAAYFTREGGSLNQKAVNLHMIEDVLGWVVVLIGAVIMNITRVNILDPIMSIGVSAFIIVASVKNLGEIFDIFLEKTPKSIDFWEIKEHIGKIEGVLDLHHIHIWSMDGVLHCATMHIVSDRDHEEVKKEVREELKEHGISHVTIETHTSLENCDEPECETILNVHSGHCHHH